MIRSILKIDVKEYRERGFTLVEILVVLTIMAFMTFVIINSVTKFKQVILTTETAKEIIVYLREARRRSINNVVTSNNKTPQGYYLFFYSNDYYWGECWDGGCDDSNRIKSNQYSNVEVSECGSYRFVKFNHVTGEVVLTNSSFDTTPSSETCTITVSISTPLISSSKRVEVNAADRTIKML